MFVRSRFGGSDARGPRASASQRCPLVQPELISAAGELLVDTPIELVGVVFSVGDLAQEDQPFGIRDLEDLLV